MRAASALGAVAVLLVWASSAQGQTVGHVSRPTAAHTPFGQSTLGTLPGGVQAFRTAAKARAVCGPRQVAWGDARTYALYAPGNPDFGKVSPGAYVCTQAALRAGYHPTGSKRAAQG